VCGQNEPEKAVVDGISNHSANYVVLSRMVENSSTTAFFGKRK
jgi:hypothetical protein